MGFTDAIQSVVITNYINFSGRASDLEYRYYLFFITILSLIALLIDDFSGGIVASSFITVTLFFPGISLIIRRFHDLDISGLKGLLIFVSPLPTAIFFGRLLGYEYSVFVLVIMVIGLFIQFAILLTLMIVRGDASSNQYGSVPAGSWHLRDKSAENAGILDDILEQLPGQKGVTAGFYYFLIPLALAFWIGWGMTFGVWWDIGLFAVLVVMLGFGLIGGFVYGRAA